MFTALTLRSASTTVVCVPDIFCFCHYRCCGSVGIFNQSIIQFRASANVWSCYYVTVSGTRALPLPPAARLNLPSCVCFRHEWMNWFLILELRSSLVSSTVRLIHRLSLQNRSETLSAFFFTFHPMFYFSVFVHVFVCRLVSVLPLCVVCSL